MNTDQLLIVISISAYIMSTLALFTYFLSREKLPKQIGIPFAFIGCAVQFFELIYRYQTSHIWPLTNLYGSLSLFAAMSVLFFVGFASAFTAESAGNPIVHQLGVAGANMEGKETRFGIAASTLFGTISTDTSTGAVNSTHDSWTPLGGLVPLLNMQLGEIVFGGIGTGLYGMLIFVVLTVFIAGLMVGRTPEFLGKKIERREVQLAILGVLVLPIFGLIGTATSIVLPAGVATLGNAGAHGFSEVLYAFSSATENNGSAFAGLGGNQYYNIALGIAMLAGRFLFIIPAVVLAGSLAGKTSVPETVGTFTTYSPIFIVLLLGVIVIVGLLTFVPADALGPIVEHLQMLQGKTL